MTAEHTTDSDCRKVPREQARKALVESHLEHVADQLFEAARCPPDGYDVECLVSQARAELEVIEELLAGGIDSD